MRTRHLFTALLLLGTATNSLAQGPHADPLPAMAPAAAEEAASRWSLGAAALYCTANIEPDFHQVKLQAPGYAFSVLYRPTVGRTFRLAYGHGIKQTDTRSVQLQAPSYNVPARSTTEEVSWWFNEVQLDLLLRPARWVRAGAGPYFTCGITWRAFYSQLQYPDLTEEDLQVFFPYSDPEETSALDVYWVVRAGAGFDRAIGPVVAFAEVDGQASCVPAIFGGEGFTFGWGAAIGLRYTLPTLLRR